MTKRDSLLKLKSYEPKIKTYILISFFPFLIMSMFVLLPSFVGIAVIVDGFEPPEAVSEKKKQLLNDFFSILFVIYPNYLFIEVLALIFLLILTTLGNTKHSKGVSQ